MGLDAMILVFWMLSFKEIFYFLKYFFKYFLKHFHELFIYFLFLNINLFILIGG